MRKSGLLIRCFLLLCLCICAFPADIHADDREAPPIRIGLEFLESDYNTSFHILNENLKHLEKLANVEFVRPDNKYSGTINEQSIYNVEDMLAQDVDGILFAPTADRVLPAICRMCEEAEVYWGIYMRGITDKDIEEFCKASPYYIGNTYENEEEGAYELAKSVLEKGYRRFALLSESKSDNTCRQREVGFQKALMEYPDAQIVAEARNMRSYSDIEQNTKSIIQAYPDLDCFFLAGTKTLGGTNQVLKTIQAVRSTERISLVAFDFSDKIVEDFQTGILKSSYGLMQLSMDPYYLAIKMINTLKGCPLESKSTSHYVEGILITSEEQARELSPKIEDRSLLYFSDDFVRDMLFKWNNPKLDEESFQQIINDNRLLQLAKSNGNVNTTEEP
ncbi:MAG: substrate-binding domain-containing protein [Eubacteriales bacterium]|nr:substrate-binding domain-containing protein [Eubacteriales bacterium]